MSHPHRIAAGGIIFRNETVLLVRYRDRGGATYLVGPGGGLREEENAFQALVREVREETGLEVIPRKILMLEDLQCDRYKMCKIWILATAPEGEIEATEGARAEGILETGWFTRGGLANETVYPSVLMEHDWARLRAEDWPVLCPPSRRAGF